MQQIMNYKNNIPVHRTHANIQCNCRQCKQFDYADTSVLPPLGQLSRIGGFELLRTIDSETWERHCYHIPVSSKPRPLNKYQR